MSQATLSAPCNQSCQAAPTRRALSQLQSGERRQDMSKERAPLVRPGGSALRSSPYLPTAGLHK